MEESSSAKEQDRNGSTGQMSSSQCCFFIDLFKDGLLKCLGLDQSNKMQEGGGGGVGPSTTSENKIDRKPSGNEFQVPFETTSIINNPITVPKTTTTASTTVVGIEPEATIPTNTTTIAGPGAEYDPPTDDDPPAPSVSTGSGPQIN